VRTLTADLYFGARTLQEICADLKQNTLNERAHLDPTSDMTPSFIALKIGDQLLVNLEPPQASSSTKVSAMGTFSSSLAGFDEPYLPTTIGRS
jgi:hypothetical protein